MRILLDENLPRKLAGHLVGPECRTVVVCGWSGKKNGELPALADRQFDVLLTLDKNLPYQQNLDIQRIAVLIVRAPSNRIQDLLPVVPECLAALATIQPRGCSRRFAAVALTPAWIRTDEINEINQRKQLHSLSCFLSKLVELAPPRGYF